MNLRVLKEYINQTVAEVITTASSRELLKKHLSNTLYQNAYYLIASTAVTSIFSMIVWVIAARFYSTYAIGLGAAIITAWELLSIFSNLGLGIGLIRFLPDARVKSTSMVNTCITLSGIASIIVALIFLSGIRVWSPALLSVTQNPIFSAAFVVCALVWGLNPIVETPFLAKRSVKYAFIKNVIIVILRIALIVAFVAISNDTIGIVASSGIGMSVGLLIAVFLFLPKVLQGYIPIPTINKEVVGELIRYSGANFIAKIFVEVTPLVLPLVVINILGADMNAYFYIAWAVTRIMYVIPISIFNSLFAEASNDEESLRVNTIKSLRLLSLLVLPIIIMIMVVASPLLQVFGAAYSDNGTTMLRIMALSTIPFATNYLYITYCRVRRYTIRVMVVSAIYSVLSLGLIWFLTFNMMNLTGVALGYIAGQGVVSIVTALLLFLELRSDKSTSNLG